MRLVEAVKKIEMRLCSVVSFGELSGLRQCGESSPHPFRPAFPRLLAGFPTCEISFLLFRHDLNFFIRFLY
jgi:hypothetical protein